MAATDHSRIRTSCAPLQRGLRAASVLLLTTSLVSMTPVAAENGLPVAKPESVGMSSERLERMSALMQDYIDRDLLAGTVTLVARGGNIVHFEAQGWRWREQQEPMTKDSIFVIMSMTKPIVSVALMTLYEQGHFLLDDPISEWIPEYENTMVAIQDPDPEVELTPADRVEAARPITIRHVLTHTAGVRTRIRGRGLTPEEAQSFEGGRPQTVAESLERSAAIPLAFHPGERWEYGSSTDYVALLVERMSGQNLDDFLRQRIFEPLGLEDTHYNVPKSKVERVAAAYSPTAPDRTIELFREPTYREPHTYFGGVAGLSSTAADYFRFAQMVANGGELDGVRILSPKTVDLMITNQVGDLPVYVRGPGYGFGLGFSVLRDPAKTVEPLSPGTFSWGGAWGTIFWIDPVEDLVGVFMTQISRYRHLKVRQQFGVLATQAIVDSWRDNTPKVMGYQPRQ